MARIFDICSDETYGNQFTDFTQWPSDRPMDSQVAAEHFLCMCFTDSVIRIRDNGNLTQEDADAIIRTARRGFLVAAAATVNSKLHQKKGDDADGSGST